MRPLDIVKRLVGFTKLERIALEIDERLPAAFKHRFVYGPAFVRWAAFLRESQYWDKEKLQAYQIEQLRNLLGHAMKSVPYYRKLFADHGFKPEAVQTFEDIRCLPYLDKETVRNRLHEFIAEGIPGKRLLKKPTSGSTGIPLTVYKTKETNVTLTAFWLDLLKRVNYAPQCREVKFWSMIELGGRKNLPFLRYGNKLVLSNRYLTDDWIRRFCDMVREFNPSFMLGFPMTLSIVAAYMKKHRIAPYGNLKTIIVQSETLHPWQRSLIEEVFNCRVFSLYVMTELAVFGGECEGSTSLHLYPQYGFTEFVPIAGNHEEIVANGFTNYAMPLIRYRTGDVAIRGAGVCTHCGRSHQLVDALEGRIHDFLIGKDGSIITRLMPWIQVFPHVRQCRFFQEEPGKAYLKIVRDDGFSDADLESMRRQLAEVVRPMETPLDIEVVFVDEDVRTTSGKVKLVDQRLDVRIFLNQ